MAVPPSAPIARQSMIPILRRQRLISEKQPDHLLDLLKIFTPLLLSFYVLFELMGLGDFHDSQEAKSAVVELSCSMSFPRSARDKVSAVSLLGTRNSKGNSPRKAIWR